MMFVARLDGVAELVDIARWSEEAAPRRGILPLAEPRPLWFAHSPECAQSCALGYSAKDLKGRIAGKRVAAWALR